MRFIQIPLPPNLPTRWNRIHVERVADVVACESTEDRSSYIKKHVSWGLLKSWLAHASGHKCWYCEAKSTRAPFDVDHFRPKLGITVDGIKLVGHAGYWWLAYEWSNFRLSCQRCNRPEKSNDHTLHGKANEFPIQNEALRCTNPADLLAKESPKFLDPCREVDCTLLAHGINGEVKSAAPAGTWEHQRADYTIKQLGLNEWNTPENKRSQWQTLATLIAVVGNTFNPDVVAVLNNHISPDHEYSSFFRSAIGSHRDKAWVEALL